VRLWLDAVAANDRQENIVHFRRHRFAIASATLAIGVLALSGCSTSSDPEVEEAPGASEAAPAHWSYEGEEGPDSWGHLSAGYELCETGDQQSPVDIPSASTEQADDLALDLHVVDEHVIDTGHTFQLVADDASTVNYDGTEYDLVQMHYHDPSEHTVDGEPAPVEFHFVHQDGDGALLVVGVLAVEGAENPAFDPFIEAVENHADAEEGIVGSVSVKDMMPTTTGHYAYEGSLTTPPCSEGVQWIVMDTPVELGRDQLDVLEGAYDHNARPVQPLADRSVTHATAVTGD
jgi:carbonic anhydrase